MAEQTRVTDNRERNRFEIFVDGEKAGFVKYELGAATIDFVHTEIDSDYAGRGLAGVLVQGAVDAVRAQGTRKVVPSCPYVDRWFDKHPDYAEWRSA